MKQFIGTKIINAIPADAGEDDKRGNYPVGSPGYKVVYEDGYASWSPKEVFEAAYRQTDAMSFGLAVEALKLGKKVARSGWNGKGMFLFLVAGSTFQVSRAPLNQIYPEGTTINYCPHIDMKTADDKIVPWLASQTDVLADDWVLVD